MLERIVLLLKGFIYWLVFCFSTVFLGTLLLLSFMLPFKYRYMYARVWARVNLLALKYICNLDYEVQGLENIPEQALVVFSKHQSTYETMVLVETFKPLAWVAKRQLLWVPFFGWAFALVDPITIDRKAGMHAVDQVVKQGCESLQQGRSVLIFPEGTRKAPGSPPNYRQGGSVLAVKSGSSVLPVAHNSGEFWPRQSFIKWPGTVTFAIGPAISSQGKKPQQINQLAQNWIEGKMAEISDSSRWSR